MSVSYRQIFETCRKAGLLTGQQVQTVFEDASGRSPIAVAQELHFTTEEEIARAVASSYHCEFCDIKALELNPQAIRKIPTDTLLRSHMIPIAISNSEITMAMVDPSDILARDDVRTLTRLSVKVVVAPETAVFDAIERFMADQTNLQSMADDTTVEVEDHLTDENTEDTVVAKLMNRIISDAITLNAGDIIIEPHEHEMAIRFKIDGVCREIFSAPKSLHRQFINRLKIQCDLDIAERRKPQDGRFGVNLKGKIIDFRVAILPTIHGELAVLRLLRRDSIMLSLTDLGFNDTNFKHIIDALKRSHGMILVTGPTGSGKSTTLYAAVNETADPRINLITVEDPVEYRLDGLSQIQVNEKAGLTFASALRSILRQDPDQVMIGEIRDTETGKIAIEAALTGHLVLSTLHTNNAPGALTRLTEMGIEPFLSASAIVLVVAQRLARRLCPECKEAYRPTIEACEKAGFPYNKETGETPLIYRAKGCRACSEIGYKGRMGVHEVMAVSEELERAIVRNASADELSRIAVEEGMQELRGDGFAKVIEGLTSIEEVLRVVV
ncbi:MAG: Flp pilus assembly complex ATPase component TadA [Coriobacteriia bacterium]|nr:Flp pilus assembly complex ATPase component TadA [Coriobacteriia bacterium]